MRHSRLFGGLCVGCLLAALSGCGGGDSADPAVASSDGALPADYQGAMESPSSQPPAGESDPGAAGDYGSGTRPSGDESGSASTDPYGENYGSGSRGPEGEGSGTREPDAEEMYDQYMNELGSGTRGPDGEGASTETEVPYEEAMYEGGSGTRGPEGEAPVYGTEGYPEGYGTEGYGTGRPTKPLTYEEKSQQAFRQGNDSQALRFLQAHAVTAEAEAAKALLDKMGYNDKIKHPTFVVRWGVGIEFVGPRGYSGNVFPIGTTQNIGAKGPRGAGGEGGFGEAPGAGGMPMDGGVGGGARSAIPQELKLLTGELGEKIVEQFKLRLERGDYGEVLKTPTAPKPGTGAGAEGYGTGGYDTSGYMDSESGYGGGPGYGGGMQPGGQQRGPRSVMPGVTLVGIGSAKDLVDQAKQTGLDVLCVFKVTVTLNPRVQLVINNTSIVLFDVATGKDVFDTKPLNNIDVQKDRTEGKPDDVDKTLVSIFQHVDQTWRLGPLPSMEPQSVLTRIGTLLSDGPGENPLPALAEIRMYHSRGLLQDAHLQLAYQRLLGDEPGKLLATGTEEEKKQVVEKWVTEAARDAGPAKPRDILEQAGT